jgi:hypothetical protein
LRWLGGQIVVRLKDATDREAKQICANIERTFRRGSGGEATITTAYEMLSDNADFQRAVNTVLHKVQAEKNGRRTFGPDGEALLTSSYDRRCELLPMQVVASRKRTGDNEYRMMSSAAYARWAAVQKPFVFDWYLKRQLFKAGVCDRYKLPYQPEDLWEREGEGRYVGLVMADGNAFGQMLEAITNPDLYKNFSRQLYQLTITAVAHAAAKTKMKPFTNQRGRWLPLIPIILAGDDLTVMLRAEHAMIFAEELCQQFYLLSADPGAIQRYGRWSESKRLERGRGFSQETMRHSGGLPFL